MSFNTNPNVFLFLACILAGYALISIVPISLAVFLGYTIIQMIGAVVVLIFALVIIYIGVKVLFSGGWRC